MVIPTSSSVHPVFKQENPIRSFLGTISPNANHKDKKEDQREWNRGLLQLGKALDLRYGVFNKDSAFEALKAFALDKKSQGLVDYMNGNSNLLDFISNPTNCLKLLKKIARTTGEKSDLLEHKKIFHALIFKQKFNRSSALDFKKNQNDSYNILKDKYSRVLYGDLDISSLETTMFEELFTMPSLVTEILFDLAMDPDNFPKQLSNIKESFKIAFTDFYKFFETIVSNDFDAEENNPPGYAGIYFDAEECFNSIKSFMDDGTSPSLESKFLYPPSELIRENIRALVNEFIDDQNDRLSSLLENAETELFETQIEEQELPSQVKLVEFLYVLCTNKRMPGAQREEVESYLSSDEDDSFYNPNLESFFTRLSGAELNTTDKNFKLRTRGFKQVTENLHRLLASKVKEYTELEYFSGDDEDDSESLEFNLLEPNHDLENFVANYIYARTSNKVQKT
jgi:hypothetical protein